MHHSPTPYFWKIRMIIFLHWPYFNIPGNFFYIGLIDYSCAAHMNYSLGCTIIYSERDISPLSRKIPALELEGQTLFCLMQTTYVNKDHTKDWKWINWVSKLFLYLKFLFHFDDLANTLYFEPKKLGYLMNDYSTDSNIHGSASAFKLQCNGILWKSRPKYFPILGRTLQLLNMI